jgi:hypothetical protein
MNALRSISVLAGLTLGLACSASPVPTPSPTAQSTQSAAPTPTAQPSPTPAPTLAPTPVPVPTDLSSPIDGAYQTSFTKDELASSPLLADQSEVSDHNWGDWTLIFASGRVSYVQRNALVTTYSSGVFAVDGETITMAFDTGDNHGETWAFRWTLSGSTLSFTRDETLGPGPTPFLVTAWRNVDATVGDPLECCGATLFPGTYQTNLDPPMTFAVDHEVDLDCVPGYRCRGDVNVNESFWLDLEFGNHHGSELMVFRLIDTPDHFARWIAAQPGVTVMRKSHSVVIGDMPASELDIMSGHANVTFGSTGLADPSSLGIGQQTPVRVDAVSVGGRQMVILRMLGPESAFRDFDAAADGLQAVIDSITWGP